MFLYFIKTTLEPAQVKIGISRRVEDRLCALQVSSPHKLELIGTVPCKNKEAARAMERAAHQHLSAHWLSGEWFAMSQEVTAHIAELLSKPAEKPPRRPHTRRSPEVRQKLVHKKFSLADELASDPDLVRIPTLAEKYGIDAKRLRGKVFANDGESPIGCAFLDVAYDGWRVQKFARAANKSEG